MHLGYVGNSHDYRGYWAHAFRHDRYSVVIRIEDEDGKRVCPLAYMSNEVYRLAIWRLNEHVRDLDKAQAFINQILELSK